MTDAPHRAPSRTDGPTELSLVLIQLFKGPVYRDAHERLWEPLLKLRAPVSDHVGVLGLRLEIDETDGYAFLRSLPDTDDAEGFPRLISRHTLSYHVSLLLALLRKRLAEFDAHSSESRLVLSRDQIIEMISIYLPDASDEVKTGRSIDRYIKQIEDLGFLRRLRGEDDQYEVKRIIRAFIDGQWLADLDRRLDDYLSAFRGASESAVDPGTDTTDGAA
jgi:hypothetical protein